MLKTYVLVLSSTLISERFSSNRLLNAFIVTLSSPLERMFRLEISFQALRRNSLSETVRRADAGFMMKVFAACGETTDAGGILYGVA